jgi:hypothetical protein
VCVGNRVHNYPSCSAVCVPIMAQPFPAQHGQSLTRQVCRNSVNCPHICTIRHYLLRIKLLMPSFYPIRSDANKGALGGDLFDSRLNIIRVTIPASAFHASLGRLRLRVSLRRGTLAARGFER